MHATVACHIDRQPQQRTLEFAAFRWPLSGFDTAAWPCAPGGGWRDADGRLCMLQFAPGRWLLPAPSATSEALLDAAARAGQGAKIDVSGKWEHLTIAGPGAARLLACAIEIESVLERRECAALRLFDCPAIVARRDDGYELWVQSSYAGDFLGTAGRCLIALRRGS